MPGELFPQRHACPVEPGLHRRHRIADCVSHLLVRQSLDVPKDQDCPVRFREAIYRALEELPRLSGQQLGFRGLRPISVQVGWIACAVTICEERRKLRFQRNFSIRPPPPSLEQGCICGHSVKPATQRSPAFECVNLPCDGQEDILNYLFCIRLVPSDLMCQPVDARPMTIDELLKCRCIATLEALYQ